MVLVRIVAPRFTKEAGLICYKITMNKGWLYGMSGADAGQNVAGDLQVRVWEEVHRAFAARRQTHGLTQAELARRIGLERERVHYWLSRPDRMTLKAAARLMAGLGARLECRAYLEN